MNTQNPVIWILTNIITSVGLIVINKTLMDPRFNFSFILILTSLHFLMNTIGMEIMAILFFARKRLPLKDTVIMASLSTASIVLMNYSLRLNTVGFYQLSKLLGVPWLIFIQQVFHRKPMITKKIAFSTCLILVGLGIATVSDVRFNLAGAITSALGIVITTQYQIWQGEKQSEFNLNAFQINHAQAFPTFITCALLATLIDGQRKQLYEHQWSREEILLILLGCLLALFFNLSTYGILGLTSPLTYQVVGHTKTALIFGSGFFFDPPQEYKRFATNLSGLCITMLGVGLYTLWNIKKKVIHRIEDEVL